LPDGLILWRVLTVTALAPMAVLLGRETFAVELEALGFFTVARLRGEGCWVVLSVFLPCTTASSG